MAVWAAGRAGARCEAWGALAYTLDQAQQAGHDLQQLLRGVPSFVDRARTPGAFACRVVQDQLDGRIDLGTVRRDLGKGDVEIVQDGPFSPETPSTAANTEPAARVALGFPVSTQAAVADAVADTDVGKASQGHNGPILSRRAAPGQDGPAR